MNRTLYAGYESEIREQRLAFSRGCAYAAIVLILLGTGLDYGLYPGKMLLFGTVRVTVSLLIYAVVLLMKTPWGESKAQWLTFLWLLCPQMMITWMISQTEGAVSLYYSGLHLAIFASGIALPFSVGENILFSFLTCIFYLLACLRFPESVRMHGPFVVNSLFLTMSATVSAVCTHFNERARFMLFRLKAEVATKNHQLEEINRSLAKIKGQMLQQEKMAALGTLAAGLLHEVNNPVNFCLMAINLALEEPVAKQNANLLECLDDAKSGMQRVQNIVSDLKIFAYRKPDAEDKGQPFLLEKAINSAERLTRHELRGIQIIRELPSDSLVFGDEAAIIGVLINLFSNAALAMNKAKTVNPAIRITGVWRDRRLHTAVRDNGPGIAEANLPRVFEPFFTTREVGQGLGLGLSICYSVIERHGGVLAAASVAGEWAEFTFDLPRVE
jgi:two-component system sensor histidine kinase PhcS